MDNSSHPAEDAAGFKILKVEIALLMAQISGADECNAQQHGMKTVAVIAAF